jgi:phage-related protein
MDDAAGKPTLKPLFWAGRSYQELIGLSHELQRVFGYAMELAQAGGKHQWAKPLKGFGGAGVLEVVANHHGDTYRAVYTVRFAEAVYVLHVFQKKSKSRIATPRHDIKLIERRLKEAEAKYQQWLTEKQQ